MTMNGAQNKALEMLENIMLGENLQTAISFTSLFVLVFESLKDVVTDRLLGFYCLSDMEFRDGQIVYHQNEKYKRNVLKLAKKPLHASLKWFVNQGVITDSDFNRLLEAESRRNEFVHKLFDVMCAGVSEPDILLLGDLIAIYKKIDSRWIYNVETDWDEVKDPDSVKMEDCVSCNLAMIDAMISILLRGKADTYRKCYEQIKDAVTHQTCNKHATNLQSVASPDGEIRS